MKNRIIVGVAFMIGVVALGSLVWVWMKYNYCDYGSSLYITRRTGTVSPESQYASEGEKGVQEKMLGPGRHFRNPWTYSVTKVDDVRIPPGFIGVIKNNVGQPLTAGQRLAEPGQQGTLRRVLTPGRWRINTFGQVVERIEPATIIKPGYVGVQTVLEGDESGTLDKVLQAGYYNINPTERKVQHLEIGYRVWEQAVEYSTRGSKQVLKEGSGVSFPLADGKQMHLDMTVVWGIFPKDAPRIIKDYGKIADVESKIIQPRVESICKNAGSDLTTKEFIEGATREKFQNDVTVQLKAFGEKKGIHFLIALVRGFHPSSDIKEQIQATLIAEEEKTTLKFEQDRATIAADLEKAQRKVEIASKDFDAETEALVQEELEKGKKKAAEIQAEADRIVAELQKRTALIDADIVKIAGQAEADVIEAKKKAEATRLQLLIAAYGGADQYNLATFAEFLPADIRIEYRYAGPGTFWTDAKAVLSDLAAKKILSGANKAPKE